MRPIIDTDYDEFCYKCNGCGYIKYSTKTKDNIKFSKNVKDRAQLRDLNDHFIIHYHWSYPCDNCNDGNIIPIPFSEFYKKEIGIEYLY